MEKKLKKFKICANSPSSPSPSSRSRRTLKSKQKNITNKSCFVDRRRNERKSGRENRNVKSKQTARKSGERRVEEGGGSSGATRRREGPKGERRQRMGREGGNGCNAPGARWPWRGPTREGKDDRPRERFRFFFFPSTLDQPRPPPPLLSHRHPRRRPTALLPPRPCQPRPSISSRT